MTPKIISELKKETEICSKFTVQPTKVAKAYKAATGKCTLLRHLVQMRPGKVCISKIPVTQCGPSCQPQGRLAEHYLAKVTAGQDLPELATKETSFAAQVRMPAHCIHALVTPMSSR